MSKGISRESREFERLVKVYSTKICSEIIKNGFEGVELWLRVAMSEALNTKISQDKDDEKEYYRICEEVAKMLVDNRRNYKTPMTPFELLSKWDKIRDDERH